MGRALRRLTAKGSQFSSRFPLFRVARRVQHEDSNRCGIEFIILGMGMTSLASLSVFRIEVLSHRCDPETERSSELYSAKQKRRAVN